MTAASVLPLSGLMRSRRSEMSVLIGADPEVFLRSTTSGKIVAAIGKLGGTKQKPSKCEHGAVQEDNVLAEYNIHPAKTADEWVFYHQTMLREIMRRTNCEVVIKASHSFDIGYLQSLGKQAVELGCEPDFCIYEEEPNSKPNPFQALRTAGGHIHISTEQDITQVVKACDALLGVPSVLLDDDTQRRTMYGKAGCYRKKPYGVEYRSLSNFWLRDEHVMRWAFSSAVEASHLDVRGIDGARAIIDDNDVQGARQFVEKYNIPMPEGWYGH